MREHFVLLFGKLNDAIELQGCSRWQTDKTRKLDRPIFFRLLSKPMTYKQTAINNLLSSDTSGRTKALYDLLIEIGLKTKIGKNTDTLLFEATNRSKEKIGLVAFRPGIYPIFSLPRPYWIRLGTEVDKALATIQPRHFVETEGFVSTSQYSLRQIKISEDTFEHLKDIVSGLISQNFHEIAGAA